MLDSSAYSDGRIYKRRRRRRRRRRTSDCCCGSSSSLVQRRRVLALPLLLLLFLLIIVLDPQRRNSDCCCCCCSGAALAFRLTPPAPSSSSNMILTRSAAGRKLLASSGGSAVAKTRRSRLSSTPTKNADTTTTATRQTTATKLVAERNNNKKNNSAPAPAAAAAAAAEGDDDLHQLTVKQLRDLVRQENSERGVLSKLRLKKDLIAYLEMRRRERRVTTTQQRGNSAVAASNVNHNGKHNVNNNNSAAPPSPATESSNNGKTTKTAPLNMPKLHNKQQQHDHHPSSRNGKSYRDLLFEKVLRRYPTALPPSTGGSSNDNNKDDDTGTGDDNDATVDVRQRFHPVLRQLHQTSGGSGGGTMTDMDLVLIGTASCTPGVTRGVSCTALRLNWKRRPLYSVGQQQKRSNNADSNNNNNNNNNNNRLFPGGTWLFDVGECTQLQVQKTTAVRPSKITKIFVTHAHGDHSFGLPGLLCLMGQDRANINSNDKDPIEIYGPEGLRMWLRIAIRYSVSRIVPPYIVHELCEVPMAPEWEYNPRTRRYFYGSLSRQKSPQGRPWRRQGLAGEDPVSWISQANLLPIEASPLYGEVPDAGRNLYPVYDHPQSVDGAPVWEVCDEGDVLVRAAPMSHGIPCVGYVVEERPRPGRLRQELVEPIVKRNLAALREAGFAVPMKAMAVIKNLEPGSAFTFPDGTVVRQEDAVEPARPGRKVAICGDTADSRALAGLAADADVVVHECTNVHLAGIDSPGTDWRDVTRDAILHGHSTPQIAGEFARRVRAKRLVLHHFSARYKGDTAVDSLSIMMRIEQQAMEAARLNETQVVAGWDMMVLPIPPRPPSG